MAPGVAGKGSAPAGGAGGAGGQGEGGNGASGDGAGGGDGAGAGDGSGGPAANIAPKYGKYGNDPDAVWKAHQDLINKTGQTERNFSGLRKSLEGMGFKAEHDPETGEFRFVEINKPAPQVKKKRFTDAHKALFDEPVLSAIEARVQDVVEELIEKSFTDYEKKGTERQTTVQQKIAAGNKLVKLFPQLAVSTDEKPNTAFNQEFYDRATEIWKDNKAYFENPNGELYAAMEAAIELGISPQAIGAAKKEGFKQGTEQKKILGPVDGAGQGKELKPGELSKEAYLALTPEQKKEYDKKTLKL